MTDYEGEEEEEEGEEGEENEWMEEEDDEVNLEYRDCIQYSHIESIVGRWREYESGEHVQKRMRTIEKTRPELFSLSRKRHFPHLPMDFSNYGEVKWRRIREAKRRFKRPSTSQFEIRVIEELWGKEEVGGEMRSFHPQGMILLGVPLRVRGVEYAMGLLSAE